MRRALLLSALLFLTACSSDDKLVVAPLPQVSNQFSLVTNWTASIGNGIGDFYSSLGPSIGLPNTAGSNQLFIAARDGTVASFDLQSGKELWRKKLPQNMVTGGISVGKNGLYLGTDQGELIALNLTGEEVWSKSADGSIISKPLVVGNKVIVHFSRGLVMAFDTMKGDMSWSNNNQSPKLTIRGDSAPVTDGSNVYWGTASGRLTTSDINSGTVKWQQPLSSMRGSTDLDLMSDADASPVIHNGFVYESAYNGYTAAVNLKTSSVLWRSSYSTSKNFVVDDQRVIINNESDHIIALDRSTGKLLWENKLLENRGVSSPSTIGSYVVVGDSDGYLHWIDKQTGQFVAQFETDGSGIAIEPLVVNNQIFVYTRNGKLYSYQINNLSNSK